MCYKYIDMETYKRKNHFEYFNSLAYPYVGITVNVDITEFLDKDPSNKVPFFLRSAIVFTERETALPNSDRGLKIIK